MLQAQTQDGYPINVPYSFNGYKVIKYLGCGSTSIVVLVENEKTNEKFSAKIISKKDIENRHMMHSIQKEISILSSIDHPNIIKLFGAFEINDESENSYIVMIIEYCENGDLLSYAIGQGFISENQKKKMILGFLDAIKYLHSKGISHGDIKSENILLDGNFTTKLCDFGYARTSLIAGNESKNGTLYYAAPELFHKGDFDTLKSDVWAIGITLYSLSELQFPFKDGDQSFIIKQILSGNLSIRMGIDEKLLNLVKSCTQMNPMARPTIFDIIKNEYFFIEEENQFANKASNFSGKNYKLAKINDDSWYDDISLYEPGFEV